MKEAILAAILALPRAHYPTGTDPETDALREARMAVIAEAIDDVASSATCVGAAKDCQRRWTESKESLAALLVTLAWAESKFVHRVHIGKCLPFECDAIKFKDGSVHHRARSLWQIQRTPRLVTKQQWFGMVGADLAATTLAAEAATTILVSAKGRCGYEKVGWEAPTIASYATGGRCRWSQATMRTTVYNRVLKRIVGFKKDSQKG